MAKNYPDGDLWAPVKLTPKEELATFCKLAPNVVLSEVVDHGDKGRSLWVRMEILSLSRFSNVYVPHMESIVTQ